MEAATLRLLSAGSLHFQQTQPIAGKGRRDLHYAGTNGCPDERHDAAVIQVPRNDGRGLVSAGFHGPGRWHRTGTRLLEMPIPVWQPAVAMI